MVWPYCRAPRSTPGSPAFRAALSEDRLRKSGEEGSDVAPGEIGKLAVRSESVFTRYWKKPDRSARAIRQGWFHTGDLAHVDEDGYIYITVRKKDLIISGGENISPREIEDVIYIHPYVLEVAVIGVPDEKWGEAVKAVAVLREGEKASAEERHTIFLQTEPCSLQSDQGSRFHRHPAKDSQWQSDEKRTQGKIWGQ